MNCFGLQRIGRYESGQRGKMPYDIGRAMLRGDFAKAVELLMTSQGENRSAGIHKKLKASYTSSLRLLSS